MGDAIWKAISDKKQRFLVLKLIAIYIVIAIPFKTLDVLPGFANIRPNSTFIPVYGFLFGPAGAWANALGNFLYDALSNSLTLGSIGGFIANFSEPLFMCFMWQYIVEDRFQITNMRELGWYMVISMAGAIFKAFIITPVVTFFYPTIEAVTFAKVVFYTEIVFYLLPGVALLVFLHSLYGLVGYRWGEEPEHNRNIVVG